VIGATFHGLLRSVSPYFVVTAPGFLRWLPVRRPSIVTENVPDIELARELRDIDPVSYPTDRPVRIGFAGIVRYFKQLKNLTDFATRNPGLVEIHIWGGPDHAWHGFCDFAGLDPTGAPHLHYHGPYSINEDGADIYSSVDVVWAVYDNSQLNVRLALPNRLYEAVLAGRWVLAAENTSLYAMIDQLGVGASLPCGESRTGEFDARLRKALVDLQGRSYPEEARDAIFAKSEGARSDFCNHVRRILDSHRIP
jgi:hypothetical protein